MAIEVKVVNGVPVPTQVQGTEEAAASETGQLDPKIWEDLDEALESLQEAMPGYLEAEKYYKVTLPRSSSTRPCRLSSRDPRRTSTST